MNDFFLKAKHWHLFLLVFALPIVVELIMFATIFITREPTVMIGFFAVIMFIVFYVQFGWMYNVAVFLHAKLPPGAGMNLKRFRIFFMIPIIYIALMIFGAMIVAVCAINDIAPDPGPWMISLLAIIPLHFFSIFCIFHTIWFIAKTLKSVEWQRPVTFGDYVGEFFLLWFYVIGICFIQPRINWQFHNDIRQFYAQQQYNSPANRPASPGWRGFGN
jgi:hypothetical protein